MRGPHAASRLTSNVGHQREFMDGISAQLSAAFFDRPAYPHRRIVSRLRCIAWMLIMASCVEATESYKPVTSSRHGVLCAEA
jgi:hypothetical protein